MAYPSNAPPRPFLGWEAARKLGRELEAKHRSCADMAEAVQELDDRYFAMAAPDTEQECIHRLLAGLRVRLETAAAAEVADDR
jgi:hypothetical protein